MEPTTATVWNHLVSDAPPSEVGSTEFDGLPGRFCLYYQPELELRDGSIQSCEALLRWWHPDFGMVRPGLTLGGTRWNERVRGIEEWAVAEACRQALEWADDGTPVQVALNVSRQDIVCGRYLGAVAEALQATGVDPALLALDVPFLALATDPHRLHDVVEGISALGVTVVIDGVGAGTSFDALAAVDADVWKVDTYTRGLRHPELHPSVGEALDRAHQRGVLAVAKQVESRSALQEVTALGYDRAFGHAISPPVTARALGVIKKRGVARQRPLFSAF